MKNYFNTVKRGIYRAAIANVSPYDFDISGQFARRGFMHLIDKGIEHTHTMPAFKKAPNQMRTYESGPAGYKNHQNISLLR